MSYSTILKDHLEHPRNAGELVGANAVAEQTNPICGDQLRLMLFIEDDSITTARFLAYGCPPTIACGSALTQLLAGMKIEQALGLTRHDIAHALDGLPARKLHAAALAIETLRAALATFNCTRDSALLCNS